MPAFYNNLFGIEITVFGIITAGIFVFLQILHSNFSYKDMLLSFKWVSLATYSVLSVFVILITGLGALHFAMGIHDLLTHWDLNSSIIFGSDYTIASIFVGFLISTVLGVVTIFESF